MLQQLFNIIWYNKKAYLLAYVLYPLSILYELSFKILKYLKTRNGIPYHKVPVIVIGNITVGGTGKTPMVISVGKYLQSKGLKIAVVSRGYRAQCKQYPALVINNPKIYGDEPVLLANALQCPVIIDPNRNRAIEYLKTKLNIDVILSDDGMQHFKLKPDIKIAVVDGQRIFGNGMCLPAGPLREPYKKITNADFIVVNSPKQDAKLAKLNFYPAIVNLDKIICNSTGKIISVDSLRNKRLAAITGIANPKRFFKILEDLNLNIKKYSFKDHHNFVEKNLDVPEEIIIMTEKDAVKCKGLSKKNCYYIQISLTPSPIFFKDLGQHSAIKGLISQ